MKNETYQPSNDSSEFGRFANFFIKYLNGSSSHDEAFTRASCRYRRLFKKIPYRNSQVFLDEFFRANHQGMW